MQKMKEEKELITNGKLEISELTRFSVGSLNNTRSRYMENVEKLEDEIEKLTLQSAEIKKEFKKRKAELKIEYGESFLKEKGGPIFNLVKKVFSKGIKGIGKVGNNIGVYAKNKFEEHKKRESEKQADYRADMENRRAEFTKYLASKDGNLVPEDKVQKDVEPIIGKPKELDAR